MVFTSFEYILFLPLVALFYFLCRPSWRWLVLLIASYAFYMYWRPEYGLLLLTSTTIDYFVGIRMSEADDPVNRKKWLFLSLLVNLGLLISFKYLGFFNDSLRSVFGFMEYSYPIPAFDILLPVGISFYTFQTLSYTIDIYRKRREPERHFGIFSLYVSFFPQLVAGPIERSTTLLPQFRKDNTFDASRTVEGLKLIMWGFYKKLVLADTLAIYVEKVYETPDAHSGFAILLTSGFFGFQLYLDFSAYTDIAIGSARLLGYDLMSNFERPMQAKSLVEFWKRWHISMTSWFFDYLYKPLARFTRWNWRVNILLTFVIIGIWHGAGWGFVFFGLIHGVFYLLSEPIFGSGLLNRYPKKIRAIFHLQNAVKMFMVFMVNTFAVVFFRSDSIKDAFDMIRRSTIALFTLDLRLQNLKFENVDLLILFSGFALFYLIQNLKGFNSKMPFAGIPYLAFRWVIYFFILFSLIIFGTRSQEPFLYFQF